MSSKVTELMPPPCWLTDDAVAAWKRLPRFRQERIVRTAEACYRTALAYVWGREDAGDGPRDTVGEAIPFAEYRRRQVVRFELGVTWFLANLQVTFDEWRNQTGSGSNECGR